MKTARHAAKTNPVAEAGRDAELAAEADMLADEIWADLCNPSGAAASGAAASGAAASGAAAESESRIRIGRTTGNPSFKLMSPPRRTLKRDAAEMRDMDEDTDEETAKRMLFYFSRFSRFENDFW